MTRYVTVYEPKISMECREWIRYNISASLQSTDGSTNVYLLDSVLEELQVVAEFEKDYQGLKFSMIGVNYIEF